ncbi:hypothetical protein PHYBOEH_011535 [Phytophthora boehmeriae]|uniref:RxLR effector protein n=1 Tax=Phytophthora boehmeriae TaxID=109152 RepID=A0A8T1VLF7_9STRA|nr:hypothetical protein PHYBOEH_011535 [Phytophthora boehmeriae]
MKIPTFAVVLVVYAVTGTGATDIAGKKSAILTDRDVLVDASSSSSSWSDESSVSDSMEPDFLDDDLGAGDDLIGSWDNHYAVFSDTESSDQSSSESGPSDANDLIIGDVSGDLLRKAESVANTALPFDIKSAEPVLIPVAVGVAAMLGVVVAAVLIGMRRERLSEPTFGPIELVSDLPDPVTTTSESTAVEANEEDGTGAGLAIEFEDGREEEANEEDTGVVCG